MSNPNGESTSNCQNIPHVLLVAVYLTVESKILSRPLMSMEYIAGLVMRQQDNLPGHCQLPSKVNTTTLNVI